VSQPVLIVGRERRSRLALCVRTYSSVRPMFETAANLRDRVGLYSWPDGTRYEGQWHEHTRDGFGIHTYADGTRYEVCRHSTQARLAVLAARSLRIPDA
jgi:hypothetical protein